MIVLLVAAVPHTMANPHQGYSTCHSSCICSVRCAEAPALHPHTSLSRMCQQDSLRRDSALPAQAKCTKPPQQGKVLSTLAQKPLTLSRVQLPQSCWRGKTNTSILVTHSYLTPSRCSSATGQETKQPHYRGNRTAS